MRRLTALRLSLGLILLGALLPARAVAQDALQQAVERGVAALKAMQGGGNFGQPECGGAALAGLALLECGVAPEDPTLAGIITTIRSAGITTTHTYSLALCILFLDRLGNPGDIPLIESLGVRLLAGQTRAGGWVYQCPGIGEAEIRRLTTSMNQKNELIGRAKPPVIGTEQPDDKNPEKPARRTVQDLPREIQAQLLVLARTGPQLEGGDNSNTQFATLGLWVARKYGLPVDQALSGVAFRFRGSQNPDGGWGYHSGGNRQDHSTATMTCAGVLGLAVAHGVAATRVIEHDAKAVPVRNVAKDQSLAAGLIGLGTLIDHPIARRFRGKGPRPRHGPIDGKSYYFLWSVERLAVALSLETIGGKDWYAWGSEILIDNQRPDGTWVGNHGAADTCFALLFLKRANLARDLTVALRGKIKDPNEVVLKSGGVGGDNLRVPNTIKPGLETEKTKNPDPEPQPVVKNLPERKDSRLPDPSRLTDLPPQASESAKLARELVHSGPAQQERNLTQLREGKGVVYTEALALAIPQLDGDGRGKARQALADRLTRLKEQSLANYLKDEDVEIRRAAALACAMKEARGLVPNLIAALGDPEGLVKRAAQLALRELTGQSFGHNQQAWQDWWNKQGR